MDEGAQLQIKNFKNRFFNIKFDEVIIFQKLSSQEQILIKGIGLFRK